MFQAYGNPRSHPARRRGQEAQGAGGPRARHQRARARDAALSPTTRCGPRRPSSASASTTARTSTTCSIEAFAVVREAARRVIGQRHYDVQLMGGAALHFGWVAEMKTGEGKTLVSTLPAYLNGLDRQGRPHHHGQRLPGPARRRVDGPDPPVARAERRPGHPRLTGAARAQKRAEYACDITYGTNNEFGFDYLRDNMATSLADKVQRGHVYAIVDEVDSILIDEARTPLIISGRVADAAKLYYQFASDRPQRCGATRTTRSTRRSAPSPHGGRHREGRAGPRPRQPLRRGAAEPRPPAAPRRSRPRSSTSGTRTTSSSTAR